MSKRPGVLWVVERWEGGRWEMMTIETSKGRRAVRQWRKEFPEDKFRLTKYTPERATQWASR